MIERVGPRLSILEHRAVLSLLLQGALEPFVALTLPLHPGRKHLLTHARWGHIAVDDLALEWGQTQAALLDVATQLHGHGVPPAALAHPGPPYALLRARLDLCETLWGLWEVLDVWRTPGGSAYLDLTTHLLSSSSRETRRGA